MRTHYVWNLFKDNGWDGETFLGSYLNAPTEQQIRRTWRIGPDERLVVIRTDSHVLYRVMVNRGNHEYCEDEFFANKEAVL